MGDKIKLGKPLNFDDSMPMGEVISKEAEVRKDFLVTRLRMC